MGLFSDKVPTAKFNQIGDQVSGVIVSFDKQQRTKFIRGQKSGGALMYWHNSKPTAGVARDPQTGEANRPVMDDVVILDTGVADEYGETERRLFVKTKQMLDAIKTACKAAGVRDVDEGGRLTCRWVSGAGGTTDPRVYAFEYAAPGQAGNDAPAAPVANAAPAQRTTADSVLGQPVGAAAYAGEPPF